MADKTHVSVNIAPPMFLLFLVFLVLKLTGRIAWSWLWVTAPLWGGVALVFGIFLLIIIAAVIAKIFS
jgi:hypothetical protein